MRLKALINALLGRLVSKNDIAHDSSVKQSIAEIQRLNTAEYMWVEQAISASGEKAVSPCNGVAMALGVAPAGSWFEIQNGAVHHQHTMAFGVSNTAHIPVAKGDLVGVAFSTDVTGVVLRFFRNSGGG